MLGIFGKRTMEIPMEVRDWNPTATLQDLVAVTRFLRENGVPFWVHGGWAVEAMTGVPLEHTDIDLLAPSEWRGRLRKLLGPRVRYEQEQRLLVVFDGAPLEIGFLAPYSRRYRGTIYESTIWVYPEGTLEGHTGTLGGETFPIPSPALMYAEMANRVRKKKKTIPKHAQRQKLLDAVVSDADRTRSRELWPLSSTIPNRMRVALGLWRRGAAPEDWE
jgi:hypothetical protein